MVSEPGVTPVAIPVAPIVAFVLLRLHVPPVIASANGVDEPTQTLGAPVIMPASGDELTSIAFVAVPVPQPVITV